MLCRTQSIKSRVELLLTTNVASKKQVYSMKFSSHSHWLTYVKTHPEWMWGWPAWWFETQCHCSSTWRQCCCGDSRTCRSCCLTGEDSGIQNDTGPFGQCRVHTLENEPRELQETEFKVRLCYNMSHDHILDFWSTSVIVKSSSWCYVMLLILLIPWLLSWFDLALL